MAIRAVLFDLDYTLWRQESSPSDHAISELQAQAVAPALQQIAPALSPLHFVRDFWANHFDWTNFGSTEELADLRWHLGPARVRDYIAAACGECSERQAEAVWLALNSLPSSAYGVRLYHDALETMTALSRQGLRLGVVTARPFSAAVMEKGLESVGAAGLLGAIVTSGDLGLRKPHPLLFETAALHLSVAPSEALMVGDSYASDIAPAAALGMTTALKVNDRPRHGVWPLAHYVIADLRELTALECIAGCLEAAKDGPEAATVTP